MTNTKDTDFGKIDAYADFVSNDPFRRELHYPAVLENLGSVEGKHLIDVGCGDGFFTRILADKGAHILGYDVAQEKIEEAKNFNSPLNTYINYECATPQTVTFNKQYDEAVSVMVLPYASSVQELKDFFVSTSGALKSGGRFISIIFNPQFTSFGKKIGTRIFEKMTGNDIKVNFLNPKTTEVEFTSILHQFHKEQYESCAQDACFADVTWHDIFPTQSSLDKLGKDFWQPVNDAQPYSLFVVKK